jgi:hypothetical protein
MAIHTFTENIHILMFIYHFILVMAGETGPGGWTSGVASGADPICTFVVDREGMVEIGW